MVSCSYFIRIYRAKEQTVRSWSQLEKAVSTLKAVLNDGAKEKKPPSRAIQLDHLRVVLKPNKFYTLTPTESSPQADVDAFS